MNYLERLVRRARLCDGLSRKRAMEDPFEREAAWDIETPESPSERAKESVAPVLPQSPVMKASSSTPLLLASPSIASEWGPQWGQSQLPIPMTSRDALPSEPPLNPTIEHRPLQPTSEALALADAFMSRVAPEMGPVSPLTPNPTLRPTSVPAMVARRQEVDSWLDPVFEKKLSDPLAESQSKSLPPPQVSTPLLPPAPKRWLPQPHPEAEFMKPHAEMTARIPQQQLGIASNPMQAAHPNASLQPSTVIALPSASSLSSHAPLGVGAPQFGLGQL